jgi:hypothetical protein
MGNVLGRILPSANYWHRRDIYKDQSDAVSARTGRYVNNLEAVFKGDNDGTSVDEVTFAVSEVMVILEILEAVRQEKLQEVRHRVNLLDQQEG